MKISFPLAALGLTLVPVAASAASPAIVDREPMFVVFPEDAYAKGIQGQVGVELSISEAGRVENCRVIKAVVASLDEASCNHWRRTIFRPARDDQGQPVPSVLTKLSDWRLR